MDFRGYRFGLAPAEFVYTATGTGHPEQPGAGPSWRVFHDPTAPSPPLVLVHAGTGSQRLSDFPLAILRWPSVRDGVVAVLIKPMGGWVDQSAGLVWRARTPGDYYAATVDPLDDHLRLFAMTHGRGRMLAVVPVAIDVEFERRTPSPTRGWYALAVWTHGAEIRVAVQGRVLIDVTDHTLLQPGRVGLITHADATAEFDDLEVTSGSDGTRPQLLLERAAPRPAAGRTQPPA